MFTVFPCRINPRGFLQIKPRSHASTIYRMACFSTKETFSGVSMGPRDPMFDLKKIADADNSPQKVDLGAGVYRNEKGEYHEFEVIRKVQ